MSLSKDFTQTSVTESVEAWNRPGDSIEQIAQNIMDEACLGIAYYQNGVVSALQSTIVAALHSERTKALRASEPVWQDIATAPKDGTRILVFIPRYGAMSAHFDERWHCHSCLNKSAAPTLWQPLPSPPKPLSYDGEQS